MRRGNGKSGGDWYARVPRQIGAWLRRGEPSAVAIELGVIGIPFFILFLGVMEVSYDLYVQASLNNAVEAAARNVQVGGATGSTNQTSAAFIATNVCPNLGGLLDCSLLTVAVVPILKNFDYFSLPLQQTLTQGEANDGSGICTSVGGTPMVLVAWYNGPTFLGLLVPAFTSQWAGGSSSGTTTVHVTQASAGFVNEYFSGGQTAGKGCSR